MLELASNPASPITAKLFQSIDWSKSPLGPVDSWPEALKISLQMMFRSRHPMFIWWGPELIQFYNDAYLPSFGEGKHPLAMGQRGRDCWPEIWPIIGPQIDGVMARGEATWHEDQLVPIFRNGALEDVYWTYGYSPLSDADGTIGGTLVVCTETTSRVMAERAVGNKQRKLRDLFFRAPASITVLRGRDFKFELANESYQRLVNRTEDELLGRSVFELFPDAEPVRPLLEAVMGTGQRFSAREMPFAMDWRRDGTLDTRYLDLAYEPSFGADGVIDGVMGFGFDVTDMVKARARVLASEAEYRSLSESLPQMMWRAAPDGSVNYANTRCLDYTGMESQKKFGAGWVASIHAEDVEATGQAWGHSMSTGEPFKASYRIRRADGEYRWFLGRAVAVRGADGAVAHWIGTATDIDDQKKAIEQLEEQRRLREQFVATLTHDLRNPLAAAKVSAQMIARNPTSPERITSLSGRIVDSLNRTNRMIENLLDANRIKAGEPLHLDLRETSLPALLGDTLNDLTTIYGDRFVLECDADVRGHWSPEALQRIVENLCSNAVNHGDKDGKITVRAGRQKRKEADEVTIAVSNTGNPIPFEQQALLFEPFRRVSGTNQARVIKGWGLGLTLVKGLAEAQGGSVVVESTADAGTTFRVGLPIDSRAHAAAAATPSP